MFVEVVFNNPLNRGFDYIIPENAPPLQRGMRVIAPFGPSKMQGIVNKLVPSSEFEKLKPLHRVLDAAPVFDENHFRLAEWMHRYYACSLGEALSAMMPKGLRLRSGDAEAPGKITVGDRPELTAEQAAAWQHLAPAVHSADKPTLIYGVTGSGKTELYLRAIEMQLEQGKGAICLVPEIALTPQTIERFEARFGACVATWHSRLTVRQKARTWQQLLSGYKRIVVGARSALFTPVQRLGLIAIDEEHEQTYKQEDTPRYHARDVALKRAELCGAAVILGSATPSIESFHAAAQERYHYLQLNKRVLQRPMPEIAVIDMRSESNRRSRGKLFSLQMQLALERTLNRKEQVMLLMNRRGFARAAQCLHCGHTLLSPGSSIPLIYHHDTDRLVCHHTGFTQPVPSLCPKCKAGDPFKFRGVGTERIESELHRMFPAVSIARMDADSMQARESHEAIYRAVKDKQIQLLVGTQMMAKGLDFEGVTFVGILSADTALNLPDFRAGERTFSLLMQMSGRAGRGDKPGKVYIQTHNPDHYAIRTAAADDYAGFFNEELQIRKRYQLPPYAHLIEVTLRSKNEERLYRTAQDFADALEPQLPEETSILGPAPHRIAKLRGVHRACLTLRTQAVETCVQALHGALDESRRFDNIPAVIDVDPN